MRSRSTAQKLSFETDAADVFAALQSGEPGIVVIDARSRDAFEREHIPGALNLPWREMNPSTTASIPKSKLIVTYCDGVGCNASTKGAAIMVALGYRVKEMPGGLDWWKRDGHPTMSERATASNSAAQAAPIQSCAC